MRWELVLAAGLLTAGCVGSAATELPDEESGTMGLATAWPALGLAAKGCLQGGGHSVHPIIFNPLPDPWKPADVLADVGPQLLYSEVPDPANPIPTEGRTMGNYHATMVCEEWTLDGEPVEVDHFGFVGMKVEPPSFAPAEPATTHNYLVTVISTDNDAVLERLQAAGFGAIRSSAMVERFPGEAYRIRMQTEGNGDYDSLYRATELGPNAATYARLWFQKSADGHAHAHDESEGAQAEGEFQPIALDLVTTGGSHHVADVQGYFSHSGTDHHWPAPGAYGHTAAVHYEGFDREFRFGPQPDVVLSAAYVH